MMILVAILCLVAGVVFGALGFAHGAAAFLTVHSDWVLYLLMLSVGISVGLNRSVFGKIPAYHVKILILPIGIILASAAGGALAAVLLRIPAAGGMAVASGLGWYSLSGVLVGELFTPRLGTIAFLSNLMREILTFCLVPLLAKYCSGYTAIAPAAATSGDTTLVVLMKYTNEEVVVMAVFNGVFCSTAVPVLIRFFAGL